MNTPPKGAKPSQPAAPPTAGWSWPEWMGIVLGVALAVFYRADAPPLGTVSNFLEFKWAAAAVAAAIWGGLLATRRLPAAEPQVTWIDLALATLVLWAVVSLAWTPDLRSAAVSAVYVGVAGLLYLLARATATDAVLRLLLVAAGVLIVASLVAFGLYGRAVDLGFGNENFSAEALVLSVCILPLARERSPQPLRWLLPAAAVLALAYLLFRAPSNLQYAALLAVLFYFALRAMPAKGAAALVIVTAGVVIGGMLLWFGSDNFASQFGALPQGWRERVQVWANVGAAIADAPILGHGWGSFYFAYAEYIDRYLTFAPQLGLPAFDSFDRSAGAGHNELLEIWFLLGLPGFLLALSIAGLALTGALRTPQQSVGRWAGAALVAWLAMAQLEFPGQNAATAIQGALLLALIAPDSPGLRWYPRQPWGRIWSGAAALIGMALAVAAGVQVQAQNRFATADLFHRGGQLTAAADGFVSALTVSDLSPKLRLRLYPQSIVAGVPYWNQIGVPELEHRFAVSSTAAPLHPVLLDLRLKFLLALTNPPADQIEAVIRSLRANSGQSNANVHVLDAAWALRLGDRERARASLALAEERLAANPGAISTANNRANVAALLQQLSASGR